MLRSGRLHFQMNKRADSSGILPFPCLQKHGPLFPASWAAVSDGDSLSSTDESAFGLFTLFLLTEHFLEKTR